MTKMKDWTGNGNSIYKTLGASNHTDNEREVNDYYATEPKATELLLERERFNPYVWECACGGGHMSDVLKSHGYNVKSSDIIDRGYDGAEIIDFLSVDKAEYKEMISRDIITNPPYKYAKEFVEQALNISMDGVKVAMFLKLQFLESKKRLELFKKYPPKVIYVASERLLCAKNAEFERMKAGGGSAVCYAWFVWKKGFKGDPVIKWI